MKRAIQLLICGCTLTTYANAQQIGSVDLATLAIPAQSDQKKNEPSKLPGGCLRPSGGGIADGVVVADDGLPRGLLVAITVVNEKKPSEGTELVANVLLRNTGKQSFQIPWSTDPGIIEYGQDPNDYAWEVGTFEVLVTRRERNTGLLKSSTQYLYGSQFSPGSMLTLEPGQWITALIKFRLEDKYFNDASEFAPGEAELSA